MSTTAIETFPDLDRAGIVLAVATIWRVGGPQRQRLAADLAADAWSATGANPGPVSYSIFGSVHGTSLLHLARWDVPDPGEPAERTARQAWDSVTAQLPDVRLQGEQSYRPYHSLLRRPRTEPPGCYVAVRARFRQPHGQRWVEGVLRAAQERPKPADGLIGAHFYLGVDDNQVLDLSEWTDEHALAHQVRQPGDPIGEATRSAAALARISVERFRLLRHVPGRPRRPGQP
jgi:hypothetical protein